ncbi:hypothetical protein, partial [Candidatus Williamhamiltonella defendens]|uniref:hypothetical protein n=1 Tax=Candidatus Williamhamiltonella defendens TaxID=138072 RepID=UPI001C2E517D
IFLYFLCSVTLSGLIYWLNSLRQNSSGSSLTWKAYRVALHRLPQGIGIYTSLWISAIRL